jgi:glucose 1-dehydrogenase
VSTEAKVALVTGAQTGIGLAIVERLQRDGYAIGFVSHARDEAAERTFAQVAARGRAHWAAGDLGDPDVPQRLFGEVAAALGRVDLLVNNAGLSTAKPFLELTREDFDTTFAVDVRAAFLLTQAAARHMRERGGGVIVNNTSIHELTPRAGFGVYAPAKAALGMLTRAAALELAPYGIRVVAVAPGAIATERNEEADALASEVPLGRPGTPAEVAEVVAFLASDASRYITGTSILVDGGALQQVFAKPAGG